MGEAKRIRKYQQSPYILILGVGGEGGVGRSLATCFGRLIIQHLPVVAKKLKRCWVKSKQKYIVLTIERFQTQF